MSPEEPTIYAEAQNEKRESRVEEHDEPEQRFELAGMVSEIHEYLDEAEWPHAAQATRHSITNKDGLFVVD
jgi:hypothetical protein